MPATTARQSRLWRGLRRALRVLLAGVLIVLFLLGGAFLFLRSAWGQAKLLSWLLPVIQSSLTGTLQVARLRSDLLHWLSIEGIDLADAEGQPAVHIDRLSLRYELGALRQRRLHISAVELAGGRVAARQLKDGALNLARLVKPSPEPTAQRSGPLPIAIDIDRIQLASGLSFAGPPGLFSHAAAELSLLAGLRIAPDLRIDLQLQQLGLPITLPLRAELALHGGIGLVLAPPERPGSAPSASATQPPEVTLSELVLTAKSDGAEIARLLPQAGLLPGPLTASLHLSGGLSMLTSMLDIALPKGQLSLRASVGVLDEKLPWQATLLLKDIELAALRADLPPLRIDSELSGRGAMASGQLEIKRLVAEAGHNALRLQGRLSLPPSPAVWDDPLAATAQLGLTLQAPRLDELHATHALLPALSGALSGQVKIDLAERALRISTQLDGRDLVGFGAALAQLHIDIESPDVLGLRGRVAASLSGARYGAEQLSRATLAIDGSHRDLRLTADLQGTLAGQSLATQLDLAAQPSYGEGLRPQALSARLRTFFLVRGRDRLELMTPTTILVSELQSGPVITIAETGLPADLRQQLSSAAATGRARTRAGLALKLADLQLFLAGRYEVATQRLQGQLEIENIDAQQLAFIATGRTDVPRSHLHAAIKVAGSLGQPSGQAQLAGTVEPLPGVVPWLTPLSLSADVTGTPGNPQASLSVTVPAWEHDRLRGDGATLSLRYAERALRAQIKVPKVMTEQAPLGPVEVGGEVDVDWHAEALSVTAGLTFAGAPWLRAQLGSRISLQSAITEGAGLMARLPHLPLTATIDMPSFKLPSGLPISGELLLHAELAGSLSAPKGLARIQASGVQAGTWPIGHLAAYATIDEQKRVQLQALLDPGAAPPALPLPSDPAASAVRSGALWLRAETPLAVSLTQPGLRGQLVARGYRLDYQPPPVSSGALRAAKGTLDADLQIESAAPQPIFSGSLALSGGEVAATTLPQLLREIRLLIKLSRDGRIALQELSARAGRGSLKAEGLVELQAGQLKTVSLQSQAKDFPVAAGAYSVWLSTQVNLQGQNDGTTLRTRIEIPRGQVDVPKLSTGNDVQALGPLADVEFVDAQGRKARAALLAAEAKEREETGSHKPVPLLPAHTLVDVDMPGPFVINGPEIKTDLQGHVRAELNSEAGTRGDPIIQGDLHALNGWLEILGRRYQIDRAQVSMSGEVPPNPLLDISISRKVEDATIYILVTGSAKKPVITFRSDPATYDQGQIIAMVLSGSSRGGGSIQQQALGALSSLVVGKLKDQLGAAVPVDVIKFDVGGNDAMGANQSSLEIGKYLRDNLYLSYTHRFGNPSTILRRLNNDQVALEWWFLRNYQIHLMGGDQGVGSLNLYWNKRF